MQVTAIIHLSPLPNPVTQQEITYNQKHAKTRVTSERCFGLLKSRFRCLHRSGGSLQYTPENATKITVSCMYLHNICVKRGLPVPEDVVVEEGHPDVYLMVETMTEEE